MALKSVCLAENRLYEVRSSHSKAILGNLEVPEDGFDEDEFGENCVSTQWVVRNTFLELQSSDTISTKMTVRRSDSCLVVGKSASSNLRLHRCTYDTHACSEENATRKSSAERILGLQRINAFSNNGNKFGAVCNSMQRSQARVTLHIDDVACNSCSNTDIASSCESSSDDTDQAYVGSLSIKTDCSPVHGVRTGEHMGFVMEQCNQSLGNRTDVNTCPIFQPVSHAQPTVTMSPMAPLVAMPFMMLAACPTQTPMHTLGPAKPPGNFSNSSLEDFETKGQQRGEQSLFGGRRKRAESDSSASSSMPDSPKRNLCKGRNRGEGSNKNQRNPGVCGMTTVILHDMPKGFLRDKVVQLLNSQGFRNKFDFIYVPIRFGTMNTLGYAFVNFVSPAAAEECRLKLEGFAGWDEKCENVVHVGLSENDQGLDAIIQRHRNSPVMHASVSDEFKPAIYVNGSRREFPSPTRTIRPPRAQRNKKSNTLEQGEDV